MWGLRYLEKLFINQIYYAYIFITMICYSNENKVIQTLYCAIKSLINLTDYELEGLNRRSKRFSIIPMQLVTHYLYRQYIQQDARYLSLNLNFFLLLIITIHFPVVYFNVRYFNKVNIKYLFMHKNGNQRGISNPLEVVAVIFSYRPHTQLDINWFILKHGQPKVSL